MGCAGCKGEGKVNNPQGSKPRWSKSLKNTSEM